MTSNGQITSDRVIPLLINGNETISEKSFDVVSPVTNQPIWKCSSSSKEDAIKAIETAQAAFPAWSKTKPATRRDILLKASDILASRADELAGYMDKETGSLKGFSTGFNLPTSVEMLRDVAGRIVMVTGSIPACGEDGRSALLLKEPYGVVFGMAAWNAPYILGVRAVCYALAAGNTCVLKGSEVSPACFWAIGSIFTAAGLPPGCLNVIFHRPEDAPTITTAIIEHPFVKKVNFTGSTAIGKLIAAQCGQNLKPVLMELGGKAPAIVLKDANLQKAAQACAVGSFVHSGQICMSTERIIVDSSIASAFGNALKKAMNEIYPDSSPSPIVISPASVSKNKNLVQQAISAGAQPLLDSPDEREDSETRMRPIILQHVTKEMDIYALESFGPTVSILTVKTEEEAIEMANDTEYGLASSVFTEDLRAGLRVAREIETGAVHINNMSVHDEAGLPHGGCKSSGWGRFNGTAGIEEFLRFKTVSWAD